MNNGGGGHQQLLQQQQQQEWAQRLARIQEHRQQLVLHVAVAHGAADAAACLLRLGADPGLRPTVPARGDGEGLSNRPRESRAPTSSWF